MRHTWWRPRDARPVLSLDRLVSPLRYDVLVRARLLEQVAGSAHPDRDDFLDEVAGGPYGAWFRHVAATRFRPHLLADEAALRAALRARVHGATRLWRSFERDGFDARYPILVRRVSLPARTETGKPVSRACHVADGCHRLALLVVSGEAELTPERYRVDRRRLREVPDNTARLLRPLGIGEAEYAAFVARGYGLPPVASVRDLMSAAAALDAPQRAELASVVDVDRALGLGARAAVS
jgi:hypothetical protein